MPTGINNKISECYAYFLILMIEAEGGQENKKGQNQPALNPSNSRGLKIGS